MSMGRNRGSKVIDLNRSRELILDMIAADKAAFSLTMREKMHEEYTDVKVGYEICGVQIEKDTGMMRIIVTVIGVEPVEASLERDRFRDELLKSIGKNLRFLIKGTYAVSFRLGSECFSASFMDT